MFNHIFLILYTSLSLAFAENQTLQIQSFFQNIQNFPVSLKSATDICSLNSTQIICSSNNQILEINLPYASLTGSPNWTQDLPNTLESLNLSHNILNGSINYTLSTFPETTLAIDLSNNQFSGVFYWSQLPLKLQSISLAHNSITGDINIDLIESEDISTIDISSNEFEELSLIGWNNKTSLINIDLSDNPWTSEIYFAIDDLPTEWIFSLKIPISIICDPDKYQYCSLSERSRVQCSSYSDCISTCNCISDAIETLSSSITDIISDSSSTSDIESIVSDLYSKSVSQNLSTGISTTFTTDDSLTIVIVKCDPNAISADCNDIYLDIQWPCNSTFKSSLFYLSNDEYLTREDMNEDIIVIIGDYEYNGRRRLSSFTNDAILSAKESNLVLITILEENLNNISNEMNMSDDYIPLYLKMDDDGECGRVYFSIETDFQWTVDFLSSDESYTIPICTWTEDWNVWNDSGCELHSYNSTHVTCACNHLTFFRVDKNVFLVEVSQMSNTQLRNFTWDNLWKYSASIVTVIILLAIYGLMMKYIPDSMDSTPLLAIPDIVWREVKSKCKKDNGYSIVMDTIEKGQHLPQWRLVFDVFLIMMKDSHVLWFIFKHTAHTNINNYQRISCLFLYISCVIAFHTVFYGQISSTVSGEVGLAFYSGLFSCIPCYFVLYTFYFIHPLVQNSTYTQKLLSNMNINVHSVKDMTAGMTDIDEKEVESDANVNQPSEQPIIPPTVTELGEEMLKKLRILSDNRFPDENREGPSIQSLQPPNDGNADGHQSPTESQDYMFGGGNDNTNVNPVTAYLLPVMGKSITDDDIISNNNSSNNNPLIDDNDYNAVELQSMPTYGELNAPKPMIAGHTGDILPDNSDVHNMDMVNDESIDNLTEIAKIIIESDKIRKAFLKKEYPLPDLCLTLAWTVCALLAFLCFLLTIIYGVNFDIVQNQNISVYIQSSVTDEIYSETFSYSDGTLMSTSSFISSDDNILVFNESVRLSIADDFVVEQKLDVEDNNRMWGKNISDSASYFLNILLSLFFGWALYQPLWILFLSIVYVLYPDLSFSEMLFRYVWCKWTIDDYIDADEMLLEAEAGLMAVVKRRETVNSERHSEYDGSPTKANQKKVKKKDEENPLLTFKLFLKVDQQYTIVSSEFLNCFNN